MSGAIRYLFDRASTTGQVHRLVIDFDNGKYWAEVSDDRFFFARRARRRDEEPQEGGGEDRQGRRSQAPGRRAGIVLRRLADPVASYLPKPFSPKRARFAAFKETALKPVTLEVRT